MIVQFEKADTELKFSRQNEADFDCIMHSYCTTTFFYDPIVLRQDVAFEPYVYFKPGQ